LGATWVVVVSPGKEQLRFGCEFPDAFGEDVGAELARFEGCHVALDGGFGFAQLSIDRADRVGLLLLVSFALGLEAPRCRTTRSR
jgi:hypothetical protein